MSEKKEMDTDTVFRLARKGVSLDSIAAMAGMSAAELELKLQSDPEYHLYYRQQVAEWELERIEVKDNILLDETTDKSLRIKIARDDLKTMQKWAAATQRVMIVGGKDDAEVPFEIIYSPTTEEQRAATREKTEEQSRKADD